MLEASAATCTSCWHQPSLCFPRVSPRTCLNLNKCTQACATTRISRGCIQLPVIFWLLVLTVSQGMQILQSNSVYTGHVLQAYMVLDDYGRRL